MNRNQDKTSNVN